MPRATVRQIDCHHWPLTERPIEVRQAIETWCAGLSTEAGLLADPSAAPIP
jgi:hypothetical protein